MTVTVTTKRRHGIGRGRARRFGISESESSAGERDCEHKSISMLDEENTRKSTGIEFMGELFIQFCSAGHTAIVFQSTCSTATWCEDWRSDIDD